MRRRSNTIHARNVDDFLDTAQNKPVKRSASNLNSTSDDQSNDQSIDSVPKEGKENKDPNDNWANFDFDCEENWEPKDDEKIRATLSALSENTADTDNSEDTEVTSRGMLSSVLRRVMVIGLYNTGKHSLINSTFECNENISNRKSQVMDLLQKIDENEEEKSEVRYQFWFQNFSMDDLEKTNKYHNLLKTYYANASMFIFIYSIDNKKSFESLDYAINLIMKEVPSKKFLGVLLANKSDLEEKRTVTYEEGEAFRDKYDLGLFKETNKSDGSLKESIVKILQERDEKLVTSKKSYSLLSV